MILEELDLERNQLDDRNCQQLVEAMCKTIAPFKKINLGANHIKSQGAFMVSKLLKVHYNIRILSLK